MPSLCIRWWPPDLLFPNRAVIPRYYHRWALQGHRPKPERRRSKLDSALHYMLLSLPASRSPSCLYAAVSGRGHDLDGWQANTQSQLRSERSGPCPCLHTRLLSGSGSRPKPGGRQHKDCDHPQGIHSYPQGALARQEAWMRGHLKMQAQGQQVPAIQSLPCHIETGLIAHVTN